MQMSIDFTFLLFFLIMSVFKVKTVNFTPHNCGEEKFMHQKHGIIQTPNFPRAFTAPIRCRWVIDASNYSDPTIYVYFTQLFVTTGLNMSEYIYYNDGIGYNGKTIFVLPPKESLEQEFVRTNLTYLVIDFELHQLEGNHLRALDNLMDVFGFNITYEISTNEPSKNFCTVVDCSLAGHCYASSDFSKYKCSCFDGFFGEKCGYGPLCHPNRSDCENGATCRHAGETAAMCICTERFTGMKCDIPLAALNQESTIMINQTISCAGSVEEKVKRSSSYCNCENREIVSEYRAQYLLAVHLASTTAGAKIENPTTIVQHRVNMQYSSESRTSLEEILKKYFKEGKSIKYKSPTILNVTRDGDRISNVSFQIYTTKSPAEINDKLRAMVNNNVIDHFSPIRLVPTLHLEKVSINREEDVLERQEFILSCVAQGSPSMSFQWFKDGIPINDSLAIRDLWLRTTSYDNWRSKYVGMLTITHAESVDSGIYTCQVKDAEQRQCRSIRVNVVQIPDVKVTPLNIVVEKGQNVTLRCLSKSDWQSDINYGYSWLKNDKVFQFDVPNLYWEDLHKGGSVLYVNNIRKSDVFKCEVIGKGRNSASVRVDVLDKDLTPYCHRDGAWPMTAPGMSAMQECPANYTGGISSRLCMMVDADKAEWQLPDFSNCVSNAFISISEQFRKLTYGYQTDTVNATDTLKAVWQLFLVQKLLPGEGETVVDLLRTTHDFLLKTQNIQDFQNSTPYFFGIIDILLQDSTSILNHKAIFSLSCIIDEWSSWWTFSNGQRLQAVRQQHTSHSNFSRFKSFEFHVSTNQKPVVTLYSNVTVNTEGSTFRNMQNESIKLGIMIYKNLSRILLPPYVSNRRNDKQLLYKLNTPIIHVLSKKSIRKKRDANSSWIQVHVDFKLPLHDKLSTNWDVRCGTVSSFGQGWSLDSCKGISLPTRALRCSCNHGGLFGIFIAELPSINSEIDRKYHIVVIIGCVCCFIQCMISFLVLLCRWLKTRSCLLYLKIQICFSTATTMLLFLYGSGDPSPDMFPYILSGLQMFLFASISSHISVLIVTYVDIISLKKIPNIKVSAISVVTVSPMLLMVYAPLSRRITNEKLTCWWLCKGSLLFYIHFIVGLFLLLLFLFLYYSVMKKLFCLWNSTKVERRTTILQRMIFLLYTLLIFISAVVMTISSIFFVNSKNSTTQTVFGSSCALLGFVIVLFYSPKNEISFYGKIFPSLRNQDAKYSPELQVIPVQYSRCENIYLETYPTSKEEEDITSVPKRKKSVVFHHDLVTGCAENEEPASTGNQEQIAISSEANSTEECSIEVKHQSDILWPATHDNYISSSCSKNPVYCSPLHQNHPEILTTRVCVELGVVKNTVNGALAGNDNSSTVVICSVDVEPCPGHIVELNEVKFTTNTIGEICVDNTAQKLCEIHKCESFSTDAENPQKADVLDRISQDLDYLLNRSPSPNKTRKYSFKSTTNSARITPTNSKLS
ncbi:uncharacterized protein LOC135832148 isoform X2 [Planococcus citri]|uniref:uncharacterized protein LOC135832148 isoform X2 n=1 Tax=Planococcus citri TaxID=170843 RepID=UPI0031F8BA51